MPPIRSVTIGPTSATIIGTKGTRTFTYSTVPGNQDTPAKVEGFVNTWCSSNITECQVVCHVFSVSPLVVTFGTFNLGVSIPSNWWQDA